MRAFCLLTTIHRFTPAAIRELVYAGIRFGAYDPLKRLLERGRRQISLPEKMICGAFAGTVGAAIATPADLLKVLMHHTQGIEDSYLKTTERR
jgi:hypothetical protein